MKSKTKTFTNKHLFIIVAFIVLAVAQLVTYFVLTMKIRDVEKRRAEEHFRLVIEVEKLKQQIDTGSSSE